MAGTLRQDEESGGDVNSYRSVVTPPPPPVHGIVKVFNQLGSRSGGYLYCSHGDGMNPFPVPKNVRTAQLHEELVIAGFGAAILTVRGFGNAGDGVAQTAEIKHDGTLTGAQLQPIVDAHVPSVTNDKKLSGFVATQAIIDLWNGVGTNAERLQRVEKYLARALRYLRQENID